MGRTTTRPGDLLTDDDRRLLAAYAAGQSPGQIGQQLYITASAVRQRMHNVRVKLGAATSEQAVAIAIRNRYIT